MAGRHPQPHWPPPVVKDERQAVQAQTQQEGFEVGDVMPQSIRIRVWRRAGLSHTHLVRHDAPAVPREGRNELAPQVAPGGVTMDEHNWLPAALVHIMHFKAVNVEVVWGKRKGPLKCLVSNLDHFYFSGRRANVGLIKST